MMQNQLFRSLPSALHSKRAWYIAASLGTCGYLVYDAANTHRELFPTTVALAHSKLFSVALSNAAIAVFLLASTIFIKIFFGKLYPQEEAKLSSRFFFTIFETFIALAYFREGLNVYTTVILTLQIALKMVAVLADARQEYIEQNHGNPQRPSTLRLVALLCFLFNVSIGSLFFFDASAGGYLLLPMFAPSSSSSGGAARAARSSSDILLLLASEAGLMTVHIAGISMKTLLHEIEVYKGTIWEQKGLYKFFVEIATDVTSSVLHIYFIMLMWGAGILPIHLGRCLLHSITAATKSLNDLASYRRLVRRIDAELRPPTPEELASQDGQCSICYDDIGVDASTRRLPCGHIFHRQCLYRWLERKRTCPYCLANLPDVMRADAAAAAAGAGAAGGLAPGDGGAIPRAGAAQAPAAAAAFAGGGAGGGAQHQQLMDVLARRQAVFDNILRARQQAAQEDEERRRAAAAPPAPPRQEPTTDRKSTPAPAAAGGAAAAAAAGGFDIHVTATDLAAAEDDAYVERIYNVYRESHEAMLRGHEAGSESRETVVRLTSAFSRDDAGTLRFVPSDDRQPSPSKEEGRRRSQQQATTTRADIIAAAVDPARMAATIAQSLLRAQRMHQQEDEGASVGKRHRRSNELKALRQFAADVRHALERMELATAGIITDDDDDSSCSTSGGGSADDEDGSRRPPLHERDTACAPAPAAAPAAAIFATMTPLGGSGGAGSLRQHGDDSDDIRSMEWAPTPAAATGAAATGEQQRGDPTSDSSVEPTAAVQPTVAAGDPTVAAATPSAS